jgi:nucleotide-binding universal stress UspA family protein
MKTLVALTDFTPAADNAALYAARLAHKLETELALLHVYQLPVSMNDMPVLVVSADELRVNSEAGLRHTKEELLREVPGLRIRTESRLGELNDEVKQFCKEVPVWALVMGTHHYSGLEKVLFGHSAVSVVRHCPYPVISVPETYRGREVRKIVFAADLQPLDPAVAQQITNIVHQLHAELDIVHVGVDEEEMAAEAVLAPFQSLDPSYHSVRRDKVTEGLRDYIQTTGADLVIALPHKHSLLEAFLFKVHTRDFVDHLDTPLLFIHE